MIIHIEKRRPTLAYRILSAFVAFTFAFSVIMPPAPVRAQTAPLTILNLPAPGTMVPMTPGFTPPLIQGVTVHPENPLEFDFIVSTGDEDLRGEDFKDESTRLIKYFLASLTVPEEEMWVNLSPYEKDRIIPEGFGETEMGRDLLAQDYILKQLTASLMYPEEELGSEFWNRVYEKAQERYGTTEIPMNTFNKVWIVPERAVVYEYETSAFVIKSHLKVMLEEDYEAMKHDVVGAPPRGRPNTNGQAQGPAPTNIATEIIREILIPEIEKEVNEGRTFANLRQIYNSVILGAWFKQNLKESLLGQVYVDKTKTKGVDVEDKQINRKIYEQYLEAFKKGVYNYIREDYDPATQEIIPRKYFSGGTEMKVGDLVETYKKGDPLSREYQEILGEYLAGQEKYNGGQKLVNVNLVELTKKMPVKKAEELIDKARKKTSSPVTEAQIKAVFENKAFIQAMEILRKMRGSVKRAFERTAADQPGYTVYAIESALRNRSYFLGTSSRGGPLLDDLQSGFKSMARTVVKTYEDTGSLLSHEAIEGKFNEIAVDIFRRGLKGIGAEDAAWDFERLKALPGKLSRMAEIRGLLAEIDKEIARPGAGQLPQIVIISDYHGEVNLFLKYVADAISRAVGKTVVLDYKKFFEVSIKQQLAEQKVDITQTGITFYLLGDFLDRGPYGVKSFRAAEELVNLGVAKYVTGNHDLWAFLNLMGFALPVYEGYNFYGHKESEALVKEHWNDPDIARDRLGWWTARLAEYNAAQKKFQDEIFDKDAKGVRASYKKIYLQIKAQLTSEEKELWEDLAGFYFGSTDVYTGFNGIGMMSVQWWQEKLDRISQIIEKKTGKVLTEEIAMWERLKTHVSEATSAVRRQLQAAMHDGKWWWQVFNDINHQSYTSVEWWGKDWSSHKGWGTSVIDELNEIEGIKTWNQANYIKNPNLQDLALFYRQHFTLYRNDPYGNFYTHSWLPVDTKTGQIQFAYKGVVYEGKNIWEGLDVIQNDIRDLSKPLSELHEALDLVNSWYADKTTKIKPENLVTYMQDVGLKKIYEHIGVKTWFTSHNPLNKLSPKGIGFQVKQDEYLHFFVDKGMSWDKFKDLGGYAVVDADGIKLRGYDGPDFTNIIDNPDTVKLEKNDQENYVIEKSWGNDSLAKDDFLRMMKAQLEEELGELSEGIVASSPAAESIASIYLPLLTSHDAATRRVAAGALGNVKADDPRISEAAEALIAALTSKTEDLAVRKEAALSLKRIGTLRAKRALEKAATNTHEDIRAAAENVLASSSFPVKIETKEIGKTAPTVFGTSGDRGVIEDYADRVPAGKENIFDLARVRRNAQGTADFLNERDDTAGKTIIVGYDTRRHNERNAKETAAILAANGFKVKIVAEKPTPTPVLAYLTNVYDDVAGVINFTASHNPYTDNGFKFSPSHGGAADDQTTKRIGELANAATHYRIAPYADAIAEGLVTEVAPQEALNAYVHGYIVPTLKKIGAWNDIVDYIKSHPEFHLVLDVMQGTTVDYVKAIYAALQKDAGRQFFEIINKDNTDYEFKAVNGGPRPDSRDSRKVLVERVTQREGAFGVSADGDGDRFGTVDFGGTFIDADDLIGILTYFLINETDIEGNGVAKTVPTSDLSGEVVKYLNTRREAEGKDLIEFIETDVGFKYIVEQWEKYGWNFIVAGEESAHVMVGPFAQSWDDGIVVGLMNLWIVAKTGKTITEYKSGIERIINKQFKKEAKDVPASRAEKAEFGKRSAGFKAELEKAGGDFSQVSIVQKIERMQDQKVRGFIPVKGGFKVLFDKDSLLLRPSGTQDVMKLYIQMVREFGDDVDENRLAVLENLGGILTEKLAATASSPVLVLTDETAERDYLAMDDVDFRGASVAIRVDFNSRVKGGQITLTDRIRAHARTIKEAADKGAKVTVLFHQGRMGGDGKGDADYIESAQQQAAFVSELIGRPVKHVDDLYGEEAQKAIKSLKSGEVLLLKNVRPGEKDPAFVENLEPLFDVFIHDAFSGAHRADKSFIGFTNIPNVAGRVMEREIEGNRRFLSQIKHPYVELLGGAKISDHIGPLKYGLENGLIDYVLAGGMLGQLLLIAEGVHLGDVTMTVLRNQDVDKEKRPDGLLSLLPAIKEIYEAHKEKFVLPVDLAYENAKGEREEISVEDLGKDGVPFVLGDNGTKTASLYAERIKDAKTVFVKGPQGNYKKETLRKSSRITFKAIQDSGAFWMTGGGDTDLLVHELGLTPSYKSLAGGALLAFKAGELLPGLERLNESYKQYTVSSPVAAEAAVKTFLDNVNRTVRAELNTLGIIYRPGQANIYEQARLVLKNYLAATEGRAPYLGRDEVSQEALVKALDQLKALLVQAPQITAYKKVSEDIFNRKLSNRGDFTSNRKFLSSLIETVIKETDEALAQYAQNVWQQETRKKNTVIVVVKANGEVMFPPSIRADMAMRLGKSAGEVTESDFRPDQIAAVRAVLEGKAEYRSPLTGKDVPVTAYAGLERVFSGIVLDEYADRKGPHRHTLLDAVRRVEPEREEAAFNPIELLPGEIRPKGYTERFFNEFKKDFTSQLNRITAGKGSEQIKIAHAMGNLIETLISFEGLRGRETGKLLETEKLKEPHRKRILDLLNMSPNVDKILENIAVAKDIAGRVKTKVEGATIDNLINKDFTVRPKVLVYIEDLPGLVQKAEGYRWRGEKYKVAVEGKGPNSWKEVSGFDQAYALKVAIEPALSSSPVTEEKIKETVITFAATMLGAREETIKPETVIDQLMRQSGKDHSDVIALFEALEARFHIKLLNAGGEGSRSLETRTVGDIIDLIKIRTDALAAQAEFEKKFDKKLVDGDESVLGEIAEYNNGLTNPRRQWFYEWLQNHQSKLASRAVRRVGINWDGVVQKLLRIAKGSDADGNPRSAARQLYGMAFQGNFGGLTKEDLEHIFDKNVNAENAKYWGEQRLQDALRIFDEAKEVWGSNRDLLTELVKPVKSPDFPDTGGQKKFGKLLLVRHGQTTWSEAVFNKWAGWLNAGITEKGKKDAFDAGARLQSITFDRAYQSDLSRSQITLSEFFNGLGQEDIKKEQSGAINERHYGFMAGWSRGDVESAFGAAIYKTWRRALRGRPLGGESLEDVIERVAPYFIAEILPRIVAGENVVISAHGNSLRAILVLLNKHTAETVEVKPFSNDDIEDLEVPLTTPIGIKFFERLTHSEKWENEAEGEVADIAGFLADPVSSPVAGDDTAALPRPAVKKPGGIDLNPDLLDLQIKRDGNGVPLPLNMQPVETMRIEGFLPVIINVTPVVNLPLLLGLAGEEEAPSGSAGTGAPARPRDLGLADKYRNKYLELIPKSTCVILRAKPEGSFSSRFFAPAGLRMTRKGVWG